MATDRLAIECASVGGAHCSPGGFFAGTDSAPFACYFIWNFLAGALWGTLVPDAAGSALDDAGIRDYAKIIAAQERASLNLCKTADGSTFVDFVDPQRMKRRSVAVKLQFVRPRIALPSGAVTRVSVHEESCEMTHGAAGWLVGAPRDPPANRAWCAAGMLAREVSSFP